MDTIVTYLNKHRQIISYAFFGIITTIINLATYQFMIYLSIDYKISNFVAIVVTKIASYIVNKLFVFKSKCNTFKELILEMYRYTISRGFTALIDYFGVIFMVELLHLGEIFSKYFVAVIVIILNYYLGKKHVFKSKS